MSYKLKVIALFFAISILVTILILGIYFFRNQPKKDYNLKFFQTLEYTFYYPDNYDSISSNINHFWGNQVVESYVFGEKIKDPVGNEVSDYKISFSFKNQKYGMYTYDSCKRNAEYKVFGGYKVDDSLKDINFKSEENIRTCSFKTIVKTTFGNMLTERKIVADDNTYFSIEILYREGGNQSKIKRLQEAFNNTKLN